MPLGRDPSDHYKFSSSKIFMSNKAIPSHGSMRVGMPSRDQGEIPPGSQPASPRHAGASHMSAGNQRGVGRGGNVSMPQPRPRGPAVPLPGRSSLPNSHAQDRSAAAPKPAGNVSNKAKPVDDSARRKSNNLIADKAPVPESETQRCRPTTPVSEMGSLFVSGNTPAPDASASHTGPERIIYDNGDSPVAAAQDTSDNRIGSFARVRSDQNDATTSEAEQVTPANRPKRKQPVRFYGLGSEGFESQNQDDREALAIALKRNEKMSQQDPDFQGETPRYEEQETPASAAVEEPMEISDHQSDQVSGRNISSGSDQEMDIDGPLGPITPSSRKRQSPERTLSSSAKRTRAAKKDPEPKFTMRRYSWLDADGATRAERIKLLEEIQALWQTPWKTAIPQELWPQASFNQDFAPIGPKDLATTCIAKYKQLAQASPGKAGLEAAIKQIRKLVGQRPAPQNRLYYLSDVDTVVKRLEKRRLRTQQQQIAPRRDSGTGSSTEETSAIKSESTPTSPIGGYTKRQALLDLNPADVASLAGDELMRVYKLLDREMNRRLEQGKTDGTSRDAAISID